MKADWKYSDKSLLQNKFKVEKTHDPDHIHDECSYFVLDPKHDPAARAALKDYAGYIRVSNPELCDHIWEWLAEEQKAHDSDLILKSALTLDVLNKTNEFWPCVNTDKRDPNEIDQMAVGFHTESPCKRSKEKKQS